MAARRLHGRLKRTRLLSACLLGAGLLSAGLLSTAPAAAGGLRVLVQRAALAGFRYHAAPRLWPQLRVGDALALQREAANPHDTRAIAVYWQDEKLGYLPRAENDAVSAALDAGHAASARISALREQAGPWQRIELEVFLHR